MWAEAADQTRLLSLLILPLRVSAASLGKITLSQGLSRRLQSMITLQYAPAVAFRIAMPETIMDIGLQRHTRINPLPYWLCAR